ncbi:winged helix-turn-helix transcriptional regulator [Streptomyces sp. NPDC001286]
MLACRYPKHQPWRAGHPDMATPRPGNPVRGSTTGRPLMAALDLFGRRWSLRILWELRAGPLGFRPLQKRCDDMSSSVMRQRLTELLDAQVIHQLPDSRYELTPLGQEARHALHPLARWAERWAAEIDPQGADRTDDQSANRVSPPDAVGDGTPERDSAD